MFYGSKTKFYKIGLLWCHSHIELSLLEVEMNLSWISLTLFRGQFDTFLMVNSIHFVRFVCVLPFLFFAYLDHFGWGWGPRSFLGFTSVNW